MWSDTALKRLNIVDFRHCIKHEDGMAGDQRTPLDSSDK